MKRKLVLIALAVIALDFSGYAKSAKKQNNVTELKNKNVSFKSESGSLSIRNDTTQDIVVFVGKVEKDRVLGGIRKGEERGFDLSKIPGIPANGSLLIRAALYNTYRGKARITEENVIYTGLVVYDLKDSSDRSSLTIYKGVDLEQKTCVYASNENENFVLELRLGTPSQGEVVATLAPLATNKKIYLQPKSDGTPYDFYATWVYVNPKTNEKTSMNSGKTDRRREVPRSPGEDMTPMRFEEPSSSNIGYDVAFITVQNDTHSGIVFQNAGTILKNQKGIRFTSSGKHDVYEISAENGSAGHKYTALEVEFDDFSRKRIEPITFVPGYKYDLIIMDMNGTYEYDIREVGKKSLVEDSRIELFME